MKTTLGRLWRWFLDRLSEKSTKTNLFALLSILVAIGFISTATFEAFKALVEQGQGAYSSISELVGLTILNVKAVIGIIASFIAAVSSFFGTISPDSKGGKTYDQIMMENDLDPKTAYRYSIGEGDGFGS